MNRTSPFSPSGATVVACLVLAALSGRVACGGVVQFSFTASDIYGNSGSGTFSYDASMSGYEFSQTHKVYETGGGVRAPITIDFTSQVGAFHVSDAYGNVDVYNNDSGQKDRVQIAADTRTPSQNYMNAILFKNVSSSAFASTALPLSYSVAQFPDQRQLTYYDLGLGGFRYFTINSIQSGAGGGAVPEIDPSSCGSAVALLLGAFGLCERRNRWRNRAGI